MHSEQRKEMRSVFTLQPRGKLQVLLDDEVLDVSSVMDVSPMGIRLEVWTRLEIDQSIRVRYLAEAIDLRLNGTVVWNSDSTDESAIRPAFNGYIIGIKLASPSLLQAFW